MQTRSRAAVESKLTRIGRSVEDGQVTAGQAAAGSKFSVPRWTRARPWLPRWLCDGAGCRRFSFSFSARHDQCGAGGASQCARRERRGEIEQQPKFKQKSDRSPSGASRASKITKYLVDTTLSPPCERARSQQNKTQIRAPLSQNVIVLTDTASTAAAGNPFLGRALAQGGEGGGLGELGGRSKLPPIVAARAPHAHRIPIQRHHET